MSNGSRPRRRARIHVPSIALVAVAALLVVTMLASTPASSDQLLPPPAESPVDSRDDVSPPMAPRSLPAVVLPGFETADFWPDAPGPEEVDPAFLELQEQIVAAVEGYHVSGDYAFAVTDLQTGHTIGVNTARPQYAGCIANFFVLVSALQDVQAGIRTLEEVDDLIATTIRYSDAGTAYLLYRMTGNGDAVAGTAKAANIPNEQLGFTDILIDHPPAHGYDSRGIDANNWITAEEVNLSLAALYDGTLLDEPYRSHLLDEMTNVKTGLNHLIGATPGGLVSHKNGFFPMDNGGFVDNDAGIVRFERDGEEYAYAVTYLGSSIPWKHGNIELGQELVTMTWEYFGQRYP